MQRLLDEHFFNLSTGSAVEHDDEEESHYTPPVRKQETKSVVNDIVEEVVTKKPAAKKVPVEDINETDDSTDEALKKLLADL